MTDPAERPGSEQAHLVLMAERTERLSAGITVPSSPTDQPSLTGASRQLASLTGLVRDLADEVLFRSVEAAPRADLDRVLSAYTDAARQAGEAVAHYSAAYAELGFQQRFRSAVSPELKDAREHSFASVQDCLDLTRDRLGDSAKRLLAVAEDLDNTPPRARAVRRRTAQRVTAPTRDRLSSARAPMANGAAFLEDKETSSLSRAAHARSAPADHARDQAPTEVEAPSHAPGPHRAR